MRNPLFTLDSLTDIVSNGIGMLILLAMLALLARSNALSTIAVPIQRYTDKAPSFYICKDDRVMQIEAGPLSSELGALITRGAIVKGQTFELLGLSVELDDVGLKLMVDDTTDGARWEDQRSLQGERSPIVTRLRDRSRMNPQSTYAFFFVYSERDPETLSGSGFGAFEWMRATAQREGFEVGWMPVTANNPPFLCIYNSDMRCDYRPSTPIQAAGGSLEASP